MAAKRMRFKSRCATQVPQRAVHATRVGQSMAEAWSVIRGTGEERQLVLPVELPHQEMIPASHGCLTTNVTVAVSSPILGRAR